MKYQNMPAKGGYAFGGNKTIIANWKMNLSISQSLKFIKQLKTGKNPVVIAAPYTFLAELKKKDKAKFQLSAQNVSQFASGAYTGEISAGMLKEVGCQYCIVGHSERRKYFHEEDKEINQKIRQLLRVKIKPILCIGENYSQRQNKQTLQIIKKQLTAGLKNIKDIKNIVITYEPIWAISTFQKGKEKKTAKLNDIIEANTFIKKILYNKFKNKSDNIPLLYGGTVNPQNAHNILSIEEINGVLVGGASLTAKSFNAIISSI